jgi:hypothetical protein
MIPLAVAIACATGWFVWQDVHALLRRLVALRERRLDADLAREAADAALRERSTRALRAADLPDDLEVMARQWGEHADSVRGRMREAFAEVRDDVATDDLAWQHVRVVMTAEAHDADGAAEFDGMLS